jgi:hypothetical protein
MVEMVNMTVTADSKIGDYKVKIENGDLKQNGTLYPDTVRRVTLADGNGSEPVIQVFRGHDCAKKASKWLSEQTNGQIKEII